MKRATSLFLLLFFLLGNSYASVRFHYCGGSFHSVKINNHIGCQGCESAISAPGCCADVVWNLSAGVLYKYDTSTHTPGASTALIEHSAYPVLSNTSVAEDTLATQGIAYNLPGSLPRAMLCIWII